MSRAADSLYYSPRGLSRTVWDRVALDIAFTVLPDVDRGNFFDRLYGEREEEGQAKGGGVGLGTLQTTKSPPASAGGALLGYHDRTQVILGRGAGIRRAAPLTAQVVWR